MRVQVLVAAMHVPRGGLPALAKQMNLQTDAIVINQCDRLDYEEYECHGAKIEMFSFTHRGVGRNRNEAILRASAEICLFADQDIVYEEGYSDKIIKEFERFPKSDLFLFQLTVCEERKTYQNDGYKRVYWFNCGRYPTYSFAVRINQVFNTGVFFSLLFGGGALFSNGEDSLFLRELLKKRCIVRTSPILIGREEAFGESSWFTGYHRRFFYDRGVLYHFLYGLLADLFALRFIIAHGKKMCTQVTRRQAFRWMREGIRAKGAGGEHR
ncbi:MAG: glycosyltransferase family 2 protein [Lachnospiraceae bacterium]|jgi:glycosyltransferase involved in cell wall biosynthesis|nr:glycosyltransferase family 2 protein [Lachnospiraceae bacterium]